MQEDTSPVSDIKKSNKKKLIWGLICLIGPTLLIVLAILLYAILNFFVMSSGSELTQEPTAFSKTVNIVLYLSGIISVLTWLPGIIIGIILLAGRKPVN